MQHIDYSSREQESQIHFRESADAVGLKTNGVFCSTAKMNEVLKT